MDWLFETLRWYLYLLALGLIFFPITKRFFSSFRDQGYAFSKTIAILVLSYLTFVLGTIKVLPFTQTGLFVLIGMFTVLNFTRPETRVFLQSLGSSRGVKRQKNTPSSTLVLIILEELIFLASLLFLAYVRGQEPSVRGLEKFMDFGFMNSILRASYFPPLDMWLSGGHPINYYYFGHLSGALLIKLTGVTPAVGYNLILATILAQATSMAFSLTGNIANFLKKSKLLNFIVFGLLGSFILNFAGNLHTIYLFTKGYPNDSPIPFWKIFSMYNPVKYWYPNATRFIPFTIHEFPSYSYVVADLHGHVFDIPFVLLTLTLLFLFFMSVKKVLNPKSLILSSVLIGFMVAVHYMTNAFDGPIYILLTMLLFFILFGVNRWFFILSGVVAASFVVFSLPFSLHFTPFASGIGLNCSPNFLVKLHKLGPFLFERGNCQASPFWMLFVLWGFFWISFVIFLLVNRFASKSTQQTFDPKVITFITALFGFSTFLVLIPEFFYVKDIYPAHFRANTMFKLGYQAFMMMSIVSALTLYQLKNLRGRTRHLLQALFLASFVLIFAYPFFAFPSYYGELKKAPRLDGTTWMKTGFKADLEIVNYINKNIQGQPIILEAQGDSYTDYERISSYTGLPTVAGWWVHEWLWRGSSDIVGKRIPDITQIYESRDLKQTKNLIDKYSVKYVVVSGLEREKYKNINEEKFSRLGTKIFESTDKSGALYQLK